MKAYSKILIVEDESIVAMDLKQRLEKLDYIVVGIAGNGNEAIKKTGELQPDLVLMDVLIKGDLDGIETALKIRELHNIPFIYLTGSYDNEILKRTKNSRPHGYLQKPFENTELNNTIQKAINKNQKSTKTIN